MYWQDKCVFESSFLLVKGLVLRALFPVAEVTVSRVCVASGVHCIMVKGASAGHVSGLLSFLFFFFF